VSVNFHYRLLLARDDLLLDRLGDGGASLPNSTLASSAAIRSVTIDRARPGEAKTVVQTPTSIDLNNVIQAGNEARVRALSPLFMRCQLSTIAAQQSDCFDGIRTNQASTIVLSRRVSGAPGAGYGEPVGSTMAQSFLVPAPSAWG
jgi:hypothetical protein